MGENNLPIALFNGTVCTTNGLYSVRDIAIEKAKELIVKNGFVSAIGHDATAEIMSNILGAKIPMNRIQFYQEVGQKAVVFKLNDRPPEGQILTKEEVERVGYSLKLMERIE